MKKLWSLAGILFLVVLLSGCAGVKSLKEGISGTSRPELGRDAVGIKTVPETISITAPRDRVFKAAKAVLIEGGASIFEEDIQSGKIVTDERDLEKGSFFDRMVWIKPEYRVSEYVTITTEKTGKQQIVVVKYKGRFKETRSGVLSDSNKQYPEAENVLRGEFFAKLKEKI